MSIVRNVSDGPLVIVGKPAFHLMPGSAVNIPESHLKISQIKNLMDRGLLKPVGIRERPATPTKKTGKKPEVKKEEKKPEAVKKNSDEQSGKKSEKTIEYKAFKKEGI